MPSAWDHARSLSRIPRPTATLSHRMMNDDVVRGASVRFARQQEEEKGEVPGLGQVTLILPRYRWGLCDLSSLSDVEERSQRQR